MKPLHRILSVFVAIVVLASFKISQELLRWYTHAPERATIMLLEDQLESTGLEVVASHLQADSLHSMLESMDVQLDVMRSQLTGTSRQRPASVADYNKRVEERNALLHNWRLTLEENHDRVGRFNLLADSIRVVAERMGEAFYPIRSPAEIVSADRTE